MYDSRRTLEAKDVFVKFWSKLHEATFRITEGRALNRVLGMPVVCLTTMGRQSGQERSVMLTAPIVDSDKIVLVASNGGDPRDPQWYRNILHNPCLSVLHAGVERQMQARIACGQERADLWDRVRLVTPVYEIYQSHTSRQLPIIVLEPVH